MELLPNLEKYVADVKSGKIEECASQEGDSKNTFTAQEGESREACTAQEGASMTWCK